MTREGRTIQAGASVTGLAGGGWVRARSREDGDTIWVRYTLAEQGRLVPVALHVDYGRPLDADTLRRLPLVAITAIVNLHGVRERIAALLDAAAPDLLGQAPYPVEPVPTVERRASARLTVPAGRSKGDDFYRQVAAAYSYLAARGNRPAVELAEANGVPLTTAHRWVKEARRRGFLPPGQKGRRG